MFADISNVTPTQPKRQDPDDHLEPPSKAPVPVISITKPPAPLPVDLPTRDDIAFDPDSETLHHDLESGGSLMEPSHLSNPGQGDGSIVIPSTRRAANLSPKDPSPSTSRAPVDPLTKITDLLDDSAPALGASPMTPSLSAGSSPQDVSPPLLVAVGSSSMDDGDESDPDNGGLVSTVRLVGHDAEAKSDDTGDDDEFVEIASDGDMEAADSIG